ncbi:LOW QUALITY PROTEIN: protein-glutamine gamma-glutamyltransferase 4 [Acomys russatus]|uniref:LOW QUALITY PROTEIN: protein-glutamine gamma-glutamyltransferase 4 n=1 Tax=Acomys russatus TaxID=60746 RepID=UPI0021E2E771|nr:LOW QUALITY PROTEIN: protein-glutamine gamma-glutamyltransferase 4 [Acomys russatus]
MDAKNELVVYYVNWEKEQNATAHHTSAFQTKKLVLRRGQMFNMKLILSRPIETRDELKLTFTTGPKSSRTTVVLDPLAAFRSKGWQVKITKQAGVEVTLTVISSASAGVGKYKLTVNDYKAGLFFLLFNPWCADDIVFMSSEEDRQEYILNDTGYIYMGFAKQIKEKPWTFGQFEKHVLNCCFSLLTHLEPSELQSPVAVSRTICTMMCAVNNGVLVGNWSGDYSRGTAPYVWSSSVPILQQHYITRVPVCFGQCWVFSGILTTALRAVGIPARSVTNFESAHDTEKNLTVDIYLDESGKTIPHLTKDSVWNFHVWTDAWMKRQDLPQGNDGWQVLDATPQEISEGSFRTGPSPLSAIRQGAVNIKYDTKFVFTEVNGDKFIWLVKQSQGRDKNVLIAVETASIGRNISTKMVGQNRREDITLQYKFTEGSPEERKAMENASGNRPDEDKPNTRSPNSTLRLSVLQNSVELGYPITLTLILKRKTGTPQNVNISCSLDLQTYTGSKKTNLGIIQKTVHVQGQESEVALSMDANSYIYKLGMVDDELVIKGFIIAEIMESGDRVATDTTLCFLYPAFSIEMPSTGRVNEPLLITCIFKNTLPIPLTNIRFSVESLGLAHMKSWEQGALAPGNTINFQMKCNPVKTGPRKFIVKFTSKQVKEVHAEKIVLITK